VALEALGQPTLLIGTSVFTAKARDELQTWGLSDSRYLEVPHGYTDFDDAAFAVVLASLARCIAALIGSAV
jgi:hypothetical protein